MKNSNETKQVDCKNEKWEITNDRRNIPYSNVSTVKIGDDAKVHVQAMTSQQADAIAKIIIAAPRMINILLPIEEYLRNQYEKGCLDEIGHRLWVNTKSLIYNTI